jgi:membrane dipeptidase
VGRGLLIALAVMAVLLVGVFGFLPGYVDSQRNGISAGGLPPLPDSVRKLHDSLPVVDLHADQLLWARDPVAYGTRGHVDVPRLAHGNVALQVFSVVTKTPRGLNFDRNTGETDNITLLAIAQRWPVSTWGSLTARALHQANRLKDAERRSRKTFSIIRTRNDLSRFIGRRDARPTLVAGLLAIEGLHALDGKLENIDTLYAAGFRMMGLTHFFDNEIAASAHGVSHGGLTPMGRAAIDRMNALSIIIDLAHASPQTITETLARTKRPVVVSHTGVAATCPGPRNLTDAQLRAIAANGGLVGIGYFEGAVCGLDADAIVRAILHAVKIMGVMHVALGSDFDGAVTVPWDTRGVPRITEALMHAGMSRADIHAVMGGNALRFLLINLPNEGP